MKDREGMQGVMREDVWSNKGWYQFSGFKGQQGFGYEFRPSRATPDPLPEAPVGWSAVIVFIFLPNSHWPPLSSICTSPLRPFISSLQLSAHKLLFYPFSALFTLCRSRPFMAPEQSHRFIGRTWPYCARMWGWEGEKEGKYARPLGRHWKAQSGLGVNMEDRGQG